MPLTVTPKELERQAVAAFQGKAWRVFLALRQGTSLDITSSISAWTAEKVPTANGYADVTGTVGTGTYNGTTAAYELPALVATFTATGAGYSYDSIIVQIDNSTYPHSVELLTTPIALAAGQSKTYSPLLVQDNA
jgi:hypothetical protein